MVLWWYPSTAVNHGLQQNSLHTAVKFLIASFTSAQSAAAMQPARLTSLGLSVGPGHMLLAPCLFGPWCACMHQVVLHAPATTWCWTLHTREILRPTDTTDGWGNRWPV